jgi:hypothetical protein
MKHPKSVLVYEDEPEYGLLLKLIMVGTPGLLLAVSIYLWSSGERSGGLALLAETFIIGLIFVVVFPRSYQVYEDHIRIVLGGPFSVKVGFDAIKTVRVTRSLTFSVNFVTRMAGSHVEIVKKRGLSFAITPRAGDLFVENANLALTQWAQASGRAGDDSGPGWNSAI